MADLLASNSQTLPMRLNYWTSRSAGTFRQVQVDLYRETMLSLLDTYSFLRRVLNKEVYGLKCLRCTIFTANIRFSRNNNLFKYPHIFIVIKAVAEPVGT